MNNIAIFDLDGCLSDDRARLSLLPAVAKTEACYDEYHNEAHNDKLINSHVVLNHLKNGDHVLFITARPKKYLLKTTNWISKHFGRGNFGLLMRPNGDSRSSAELKPWLFEQAGYCWRDVVSAYDDREDVLAAYKLCGVETVVKLTYPCAVPEILRSMAKTYEERNAVYGDNYKRHTEIMKALFPNGIKPEVLHSNAFGILMMKISKLTRFINSDLTHIDSIHDDAVYSAMIEELLHDRSNI